MAFSFGNTKKQDAINKIKSEYWDMHGSAMPEADALKAYEGIKKTVAKAKAPAKGFSTRISSDDLIAPETSIASYLAKTHPKNPTTNKKSQKKTIQKQKKTKVMNKIPQTKIQKRNANIASDIKVGSLPKNSKKVEAPEVSVKSVKSSPFIGPRRKPVDWQAIDPAKGSSGVFARDGYVDENVTAGENSVDVTNSPDYVAPTKPVVAPVVTPEVLDPSGLSPQLKAVYDNMPNDKARSAFLGGMNAQADRIAGSALNAPSLTEYAPSPEVVLPSLEELNARGEDQSREAVAAKVAIADAQTPYVDKDPRLKLGTEEYMNKYDAQVVPGTNITMDEVQTSLEELTNTPPKAKTSAFVDPQIAEFDAPFTFDDQKVNPKTGKNTVVVPKNPYVPAKTGKKVAPSVITHNAGQPAQVQAPVVERERFATVDPLNLFGNRNGVNPFASGGGVINNARFSGGYVPQTQINNDAKKLTSAQVRVNPITAF